LVLKANGKASVGELSFRKIDLKLAEAQARAGFVGDFRGCFTSGSREESITLRTPLIASLQEIP
jgi:hypothetical protein